MSAPDQAAPISTDDLRKLVAGATPGPWELCAHLRLPNENGCNCGYRGVVYGRGDYAICQPGHDKTPGEECLDPPRLPRVEEIANMRLVAIVPQLAAELLARRADLAAPSAPVVHPSLALESSEMPYRIFTDSSRIWMDDSDGGSLFAYVREGAAPSAPAEVEGLVERLYKAANKTPTKDDAVMREAATALTALQARAERAEAALRAIAEGNLGDAPWQANYDKIRQVARAALRALAGERG